MDTYYVSSSNKYNFLDIKQSNRSISELQKIILYTPNFCRDQQSISTNELKSYIVTGITFFTRNTLNQITGLINFDINNTYIYLLGICVPGSSIGVGSYLITLLKRFAKANNLTSIKLSCYNELKDFYLKQGFTVVEEENYYDSDDEERVRFDMVYNMSVFTAGKRRKSRKKKRRKNKKSIKVL